MLLEIDILLDIYFFRKNLGKKKTKQNKTKRDQTRDYRTTFTLGGGQIQVQAIYNKDLIYLMTI